MGLGKPVTGPFKTGNCWYQFVRFLGCTLNWSHLLEVSRFFLVDGLLKPPIEIGGLEWEVVKWILEEQLPAELKRNPLAITQAVFFCRNGILKSHRTHSSG